MHSLIHSGLLHYVFGFLPFPFCIHKLSRTCKLFHELIFSCHHLTFSATSPPKIVDHSLHHTDKLIPFLSARFCSLDSLALHRFRTPTLFCDEFLEKHKMQKLQHLALVDFKFSQFKLSGTYSWNSLDLTCCSNLTRLEIQKTNYFSHPLISLTTLNLSYTNINEDHLNMDIFPYCPQLQHFIAKGCNQLTELQFSTQSLSTLNLRMCTKFRYIACNSVPEPRLESLNLLGSSVTLDDLRQLHGQLCAPCSIPNQRYMTSLEIRRCTDIIFQLDHFTLLLSNYLAHLHTLLASRTHMTDESTQLILIHCKSLRILELSQCKQLKKPNIVHQQLCMLYLDQSSNIEDGIMIHCPELIKLNLAELTNLSISTILTIVTSCVKLQRLNISKCPLVQDCSPVELFGTEEPSCKVDK